MTDLYRNEAKKYCFLKKKNQNSWLNKTEIFNSDNSLYFFVKISGITLICRKIWRVYRIMRNTLLDIYLEMNSSDSFTNLEFRIYDFLTNIYFSTSKLRKNCFGQARSLFSFSTPQTEKNLWKNLWKKLVKQIGKNIWTRKKLQTMLYSCKRKQQVVVWSFLQSLKYCFWWKLSHIGCIGF